MRRFWDAAGDARSRGARRSTRGALPRLCRPEPLEALFADAGLLDVESLAIDVPTVFRDFDDYWAPFLGGQGPAPSYVMSLQEVERTRLRERLRERLPAAADGSISLVARAWAARGRKP